MKRILSAALLVFGSAMMAVPAMAAEGLKPAPMADELPPPVTDYGPVSAPAADTALPAPVPVADGAAPPAPCDNCQAARRYDSQEVIKKIRELDRSHTINTTEIAPEHPRRPWPGYRIRDDVTLVNFVVHKYRIIESPGLVPVSEGGGYRPAHDRFHRAACRYGRHDRHGACRPVLRVRG